jgi:hypothetical protein
MVLEPLVGALGTALFARALGLRPSAALSAGFVFGWCGFQIGWVGQPMVRIAMWLPWALLGVLRVAEGPTPARIALTGLVLAFPPLSGHPEVAAYVALMAAGYALVLLVWPPPCHSSHGGLSSGVGRADRSQHVPAPAAGSSGPAPGPWRVRLRAFGGLAAAGVLALLLSAIQTLPTVEWIPQLEREILSANDPMPSFYALNLVLRHMAAAPLNVAGIYIPNGAMYAGLVTLMVAPAALLHPRRREVWFFVAVLATALQFTFGVGPLAWLHQQLPVPVDFPKSRIILLADFALAMLAGFGIAALATASRGSLRLFVAVAVAIAVGVAGLLLALPDPAAAIDPSLDPFSAPRVVFQSTGFALAILLAGTLALLAPAFGLWTFAPGPGRLGRILCALVALDMLTFAYGHVPFSRTDTLLATPPVMRFLQERTDASSRVLATRNVVPYNWEAQFRLATPSGYLYITEDMVEVMAPITIGPDPGVVELRLDRLLDSRSPLIDFLGVRYLIASNDDGSADQLARYPDRFPQVYDDGFVSVFENPRALPRTTVIPCNGIEVQEFTRRRVSRMNSPVFDPRTKVVLEDSIRCPKADPPGAMAPTEAIEVLEAGFNAYAVRADVAVPSLLVFADTYYGGWRAFVDGAEVPILRANHAFKAVRVEPGQREVRFVFDPWSFKLGVALSGSGMAVVVGLLVWSLTRRTSRRRR